MARSYPRLAATRGFPIAILRPTSNLSGPCFVYSPSPFFKKLTEIPHSCSPKHLGANPRAAKSP
jgi:hypothetical protein